ncbi:MAG TPA: hypothetical protein VHB97_25740 [Polyangia bacterium]|jgi:tetratricopeptide (TPR) repeat protein|nr:hypothetical protein [Polyangia bacterium]
MRHIKKILGLLLVIGLCLPSLARAAGGTDPATESARRFYMSGTKHFDLTEYREALNDFKQAYRVKEDPVFLYNIAQCLRLLDEKKDALKFYHSYLNRAPDAPNRAEVEQRITTLQADLDREAAAAATSAPPPAVVTPPTTPVATTPVADAALQTHTEARTPVYKKWWLWTIVGVVVAGAAVGVGVGLAESSPAPWKTGFPTVTF